MPTSHASMPRLLLRWSSVALSVGLLSTSGCFSAQPSDGDNTYTDPGTLTLEPNQLNSSDAATAPPGPLNMVYGLSSESCLAALGDVTATTVQFLPCDGSAGQQWTYQHGHFQAYNGACLSVAQTPAQVGTVAQLTACDATYTVTDQLWTYQGGEVVLNDSSMCLLPVQGNPSAAVYTCPPLAANNDAMWVLGHSKGNGVYGVLWTPAGANAPCMTAQSGAAVALSACTQAASDTDTQRADQSWAAAGTAIISLGTAQCVTLDPTSGAQGAAAGLAGCTGAASQQWAFEAGQVRLQGTTVCLGVDALSAGSLLHGVSCSTGATTAQWALGL